jgi:hypothetical protein
MVFSSGDLNKTIIITSGHLTTLQRLRANGCDLHGGTSKGVARGGHVAALQWARANGCGWNRADCMQSAKHYLQMAPAGSETREWILAQPA